MSTSSAGRRGGSRIRAKYGEDYYRRIGKKGGMRLKEKRGSEYYRIIAQKGGQTNVSKYGVEHFAEMGQKGGNTTKKRLGKEFYSRIGRMGALARRPTAEETRRLTAYVLRQSGPPRVGYADILWAILNSSEFMFNH